MLAALHFSANKIPCGGIVASGFQTLLIGFLLRHQTGLRADAPMGSPGMDNIRWLHPVCPGDRLKLVSEVLASNPSKSRPDRGRTTVHNQDDVCGAENTGVHILKRRQQDI